MLRRHSSPRAAVTCLLSLCGRTARTSGSSWIRALRCTTSAVAVARMDVTLVRVNVQEDWVPGVAEVAKRTRTRLYAWFKGSICGVESLKALATLYEAIARDSPTLDVVPLMPFAGWTDESVARLEDLQTLAAPSFEDSSSSALLAALNQERASVGLAEMGASMVHLHPGFAEQGKHDGPTVELLGTADGSIGFSDVAVGGTFDSLHAGHRLLLAVAALVSTETVWLGIASDALLAKKTNIEVMERYEQRESNACEFVHRVNPGLSINAGPLTDPNEPPLAATLPEMTALVVSRETTAGAEWIDAHRKSLSLRPLSIVVVGLIAADGQDPKASKLSSSALREKKANATQRHA